MSVLDKRGVRSRVQPYGIVFRVTYSRDDLVEVPAPSHPNPPPSSTLHKRFPVDPAGTLDGRPWKTLSLLCVLCTFIVAFRLGLGPIPWFVATELTPADRGGGLIQSASSSFSWFLSFVIMKTFKTLVQQYPVQLWTTFAGMSAVGFAFIALCVPETNNKSRQQIRADMMGRAHDGVAC